MAEITKETFEMYKLKGIAASEGVIGAKYLLFHVQSVETVQHRYHIIQITGTTTPTHGYWSIAVLHTATLAILSAEKSIFSGLYIKSKIATTFLIPIV